MNLEILSFGIFIGGIMAMFFIGLGVIMEDVRHYLNDKRELADDPGDDVSVHRGNGSRSCNNRCAERTEEAVIGLQTLRMALSRQEKEWLDFVCECAMREEIRNETE